MIVLFYIISKIPVKKGLKYFFITLSIIIILGSALDQIIKVKNKFASINIEKMSDQTLGINSSGRINLWVKAYEYLSEDPTHFWVGGGIDDFLNYSSINTQNHFLKIAVDHGMLGLLLTCFLYCNIILKCIKELNNTEPNARLLALSLIYTTIGMVGIGNFSHFNIGSNELSTFWFVTGWFIAEVRKSERVKLENGK